MHTGLTRPLPRWTGVPVYIGEEGKCGECGCLQVFVCFWRLPENMLSSVLHACTFDFTSFLCGCGRCPSQIGCLCYLSARSSEQGFCSSMRFLRQWFAANVMLRLLGEA